MQNHKTQGFNWILATGSIAFLLPLLTPPKTLQERAQQFNYIISVDLLALE